MADVGVTINCSTGEAKVAPLTDDQTAFRAQQAAQADADRQARDAKEAVRANAVTQLKAKAKTDPNLALVCQAMGIDPNS